MIRDKEIIGVRKLSLYLNKGVRFERPIIEVEDEIDLIAVNDGNFTISEVKSQIKWERTLSYSGNYKQAYFDEFIFLVHGISNEIPQVINTLRSNRLGYIVDIETTGGDKYTFQSPIFINSENIKQINSHSWEVTLGYRIPTFSNRLTRLSVSSIFEPQEIVNSVEIQGIRKLALYINDNVRIRRPDPSKENEVDLIAHGEGSFVILDVNELMRWEREVDYSGNYKQNFIDTFTFLLHGIKNNVPEILESLRNNRLGYIAEIITTGGKSFVFPAPVFINEDNTKKVNSHSWEVSLSYRVPTFEDKLIKLNTVLMTESYILLGDDQILSSEPNTAIVSN